MEGRGNLFLLFFCTRFQNFPMLVIFGTAANSTMSDPFFPGIGIFGSSWDRRKFCGVIQFDRKRLPFFGKDASSWESWETVGSRRKNSADLTEISFAPAQTKFPFSGSAHSTHILRFPQILAILYIEGWERNLFRKLYFLKIHLTESLQKVQNLAILYIEGQERSQKKLISWE